MFEMQEGLVFLCDVNGKVFCTTIRPTMLYETEEYSQYSMDEDVALDEHKYETTG